MNHIQTANMKMSFGISRRCLSAFTLIELLLVITIIGILAGIGIPHLKGWGEANTMTSASRQLMDDLAYARLKAISTRSDVYVVFIPPGITNIINSLNQDDRPKAINLLPGQFTSYALLQKRQVGDQPGRSFPKYLTPWKSLPDTVFIDTDKFVSINDEGVRMANFVETNRPFGKLNLFPFPTASSPEVKDVLPYLQFDSQGRLVSERIPNTDRYFGATIPLTRGSIFYARDADGKPIIGSADVVETPAGNSTDNYNNIRIDWLTGRARLERREIQ